MKTVLLTLADKYGGFIVGGLIGAIVHRVRNTMSFRAFLGVLFVSAFVGLCVGILLKNYLNAPDEVVFVVCSISGVFSKDILDEIQQVISYISVFIKNKANINTDNSENNPS
ncbi:phage holin family protein [Flavicella sediminum]|uniref:phage holin family protein n=1 Tax=Flavicella sediminum TaxID=2585141 RepID=UPI001123DA45|nr:phage holin family protein [Flavicella sediminum]